MTSILSGFDTVQQALAAQQFALSITQKNVANANNPDYTRQEVVFTGDEAEWTNSGVPGVSLQASRNKFIDVSISQELQSLGKQSVTSDALQQIDAIFNGSGTDLQQSLSNFFNSFASLSATPEDLTLRQQVLSTANVLSGDIRRTYSSIQQVQTSEDRALVDSVDEVNSITAQIADLNKKIQSGKGSQSEGDLTLLDSRQQLLVQLSSLVDLSYYETESGSITVTTQQGEPLVAGDQSHALKASVSSSGIFQGVFLDGKEITGSLNSGKLGGLIDVRDNKITGYLATLDDLAATIISKVNEQHAQGSDLNGADGGDFFVPFAPPAPGSNSGAARSMAVALTDPKKIAAAGLGAGAGDNANAKLLAAISDEKLFSSSSATSSQFYSDLIYRIGTDEKTAQDNVSTQDSVLNQLKNQRDALSGVNLDEEAVSLIKYQKAYQASARYASVLDTLSGDILQILGG